MIDRASFSRQAAYIAKHASEWAGACLWQQPYTQPMDDDSVKRFCAHIRDKLALIESMHSNEDK